MMEGAAQNLVAALNGAKKQRKDDASGKRYAPKTLEPERFLAIRRIAGMMTPTDRLIHAIVFHVEAYGRPADEDFLVGVLDDMHNLSRDEATAVIDMAELEGKVLHHGGSHGPHKYSVPESGKIDVTEPGQ